jgi:trk system potassium uptake protein TrkH
VVIGGLGYLATDELLRFRAEGGLRSRRRLSTHTFAVVATTAVLLVGGTVLFTIFEWRGVLAPFGVTDRILNGWFMSVTPRTAGFNTVPYGAIGNETAFLTIIFMVIGGSPGSTAGGMKTTTWAILAALAFARARGRSHVEIHGRTVPDGTVQRTVSLVLLGFAVSIAAVFLLGVVHTGTGGVDEARREVLPLVFEVVSAFGTVGLSMGYTQQLGEAEKIITIVLMFLGRVGPLAFFAAISIKARRDRTIRNAREDLIVG